MSSWLRLGGHLILLMLTALAAHAEETAAGVLEHARAVYAALGSYSDSGTVLKEYAGTGRDERSFATAFQRAPRHFLLDYQKPSDRLVIWGDPDVFHVWWKTTGQVSDYPNPKNTGAITLSDYPTDGVTTKIPPLLYAKANLPGAVAHFEPERLTGPETLAGVRCYRLEGTTSDSYGATGNRVNVRQLTVWIDAASFLLRKVVEESPATAGQVNRTTTTFEPKANPPLGEDAFKFGPPK